MPIAAVRRRLLMKVVLFANGEPSLRLATRPITHVRFVVHAGIVAESILPFGVSPATFGCRKSFIFVLGSRVIDLAIVRA